MITLKMGSYSSDEKMAISRYLCEAHSNLIREVGCHMKSAVCAACKYRHVCTDLQSAYIFVCDTYYDEKAGEDTTCG